MTRRIKRHPAFELVLEIRDEGFMRTPRERQRNWLLSRVMKETADELVALDEQAKRFIAGGEQPIEMTDRRAAALAQQDIMEDWQIPIMQAMAEQVCRPGGDVLEIGFGRGVASGMIQDLAVGSHTIIECNPHVVASFGEWRGAYPGRDIRIVEGMWQDVIDGLGEFDGIFFHTYPLDDQEYVEQVAQSVTFAEHFFDTAAAHLRAGGAFTYLSNEADSLSRAHQRALLSRFSSFQIGLVSELEIPQESRDSHWSQQMVVVRALK
jgi:guanidinoacetate N-methyltransferase